jgi:hypothetical protein
MANRHKASGGKVSGGISKAQVDYGNPDVLKEAKAKKRGGSCGKAMGGKSKGRLDKYARGGKVGGDCTKSPFTSAYVKTNGDA